MILKKSHIANLMLSFILLIATGCVGNSYADFEDDNPEMDAVPLAYMPLVLQGDGSYTTRADEFDYGYANEMALAPGDCHFALLYTKDAITPTFIATLDKSDSSDNKEHSSNFSISYAKIWGNDMTQDEEFLKSLYSCIVILNSPYTQQELRKMDKNSLLAKVVSKPTITGTDKKEYFTMVSSTFVDNDGNMVIETLVDPTKIYDSRLEAQEKALAGEAAVMAQVERLAAKFQVIFNNNELKQVPNTTYTYYPTVSSISVFKEIDEETGAPVYDRSATYQVRITGWGINAREKEGSLFKKITANGNYFKDWNDEDNFRSYWSEDLHYKTTVYPLQYRKAVDKDQYNYETLEAKGENPLKNYSYNEFVTQNNFDKKIYTLENTYDFKSEALKSLLGKRIDLLAGTHLIVTAELLTNLDGKGYTARDVYRDRTGNFYRNQKECFITLVTEFNNTLKSQDKMDFTPYIWDEPDKFTNQGLQRMSTQGEYQLCHNGNILTLEYMNKLNLSSYIIPATVDGGDGKCMIWIPGLSIQKVVDGQVTNTKMGVLESIENDKEYGNEIHHLRSQPVNENEFKSFLYEWMGALEHFTDGKMYYAIPVEHRGEDVHGVVRNHSYSFSINGIGAVGTSVDIPDQPIVPRIVENNNRIDFKTEILDWHNFETSFTPSGF